MIPQPSRPQRDALPIELQTHGASSGNRTRIAWLATRSISRYTIPAWWKGVFILNHLKLDGTPLPVAVRAYIGLIMLVRPPPTECPLFYHVGISASLLNSYTTDSYPVLRYLYTGR